jgi:beta-N-acetylhexosaminidase
MTAFHPGQLLMVDIQGQQLDKATAEFLRKNQIRAVCLLDRNLGNEVEIQQLTHQLREVMGAGALIGIEPSEGLTALGTSEGDGEAAAEIAGAQAARLLRNLGFNWNFAPALGAGIDPALPVDPAHLAAWMRGSLREGVACCFTQFPSPVDAVVEPAPSLASVDKSRAALDALELQPFHAVKGFAPVLMLPHVIYPQIDPDHPATLSPKVLGEIVRRDWAYDGVVISDSLADPAIQQRYGYGRAAVLAVQAGADLVLVPGSQAEQRQALEALKAAFRRGELLEWQGERARARLDALASAYLAGAVAAS